MDLSFIFKAMPAPGQDGGADAFSRLRVGDLLDGRVVRLEPDGRALIDLGHFRALAHTAMEVQPGQTLRLKVAHTGEPIQLRLVTEPAVAEARVLPQLALDSLVPQADRRQLAVVMDRVLMRGSMSMISSLVPEASSSGREMPLSQGTSAAGHVVDHGSPVAGEARAAQVVRQAFAGLKAFIAPWPDAPSAAQLAQWVRSVVEDRGVLFETRLADVLATLAGTRLSQSPPPDGRAHGTAAASEARPGPVAPSSVARHDAQMVTEARQGQGAMPPPGGDGVGTATQARQHVLSTVAGAHPDAGSLSPGDSKAEPPLPPGDTAALARVVQGLFLRDLKPQLLVLNAFLQGPEEPLAAALGVTEKDVAFVRRTVARLLSHVVTQQERVVQRSGSQDLFQVIAHMVPIKEGQSPVRLKVYYPKRGHGSHGQPGHRIALLLDMDRLGPVRVDLAMVERDLRIRFFVRDTFAQTLIDTNRTAVTQALEGHFDHVQVVTQISRHAIDRFDGEDATAPALGRIDIQA